MVFALETYWPSADGWGAARIEEEVVVTADGCEVITKFPAEELLVAGQRYFAVGGPLHARARQPVAPQHRVGSRGGLMTTIGFLGLGTMGSAMARRLVDAGHDVRVWNRSADAAADLVAAGARLRRRGRATRSPRDCRCRCWRTMPRRRRCSHAAEVGRGTRHPCQHGVDQSRVRRPSRGALPQRRRGVRVGSRARAGPRSRRRAELNILAAGADADIEAVMPVLEILGAKVWRLGERPRIANVVKVAVNYNIIHAIQALGESIAMTERQGVDPALFHELLTSTLFDGVVYRGYGARSSTEPTTRRDSSWRWASRTCGWPRRSRPSALELPTAPALHRVYEIALADDELAATTGAPPPR